MNLSAFSELFCQVFRQNNLERYCTETIIGQFYRFTGLLIEANSHVNLTAIREVPDIIAKHYADCLLAEPLFPQKSTVLDLGCGGGFPTLPLAIVRPDLHITALDSTQKKIAFVTEAAAALGLPNVQPLCARAEDRSLSRLRNSFDVVTSRAMAKMNVLCELAMPYVKIGGKLIAYKGTNGEVELQESGSALQIFGSEQTECVSMQLKLPVEQKTFDLKTAKAVSLPRPAAAAVHVENRCLLVAVKSRPTPAQYPRTYAVIQKKPL